MRTKAGNSILCVHGSSRRWGKRSYRELRDEEGKKRDEKGMGEMLGFSACEYGMAI